MKAGAARVRSRFHGSECLSKVGERLHSMWREKTARCVAANDISNNTDNGGSHFMRRLERSARGWFHTHLYVVFTGGKLDIHCREREKEATTWCARHHNNA